MTYLILLVGALYAMEILHEKCSNASIWMNTALALGRTSRQAWEGAVDDSSGGDPHMRLSFNDGNMYHKTIIYSARDEHNGNFAIRFKDDAIF